MMHTDRFAIAAAFRTVQDALGSSHKQAGGGGANIFCALTELNARVRGRAGSRAKPRRTRNALNEGALREESPDTRVAAARSARAQAPKPKHVNR